MICSFDPIIGKKPKVLILGSMPSVKSLEEHQYYGHPRNQFWPILFAILGQPYRASYADRLALIEQAPIILWDVLQSCEREGSLDTAIREERPNDIQGLLTTYPTVELIVFNGGKAEQSFKRFFSVLWKQEEIAHIKMPSTSPAYTLGLEKKMEKWKQIESWII